LKIFAKAFRSFNFEVAALKNLKLTPLSMGLEGRWSLQEVAKKSRKRIIQFLLNGMICVFMVSYRFQLFSIENEGLLEKLSEGLRYKTKK
jgi:hypothetical protein